MPRRKKNARKRAQAQARGLGSARRAAALGAVGTAGPPRGEWAPAARAAPAPPSEVAEIIPVAPPGLLEGLELVFDSIEDRNFTFRNLIYRGEGLGRADSTALATICFRLICTRAYEHARAYPPFRAMILTKCAELGAVLASRAGSGPARSIARDLDLGRALEACLAQVEQDRREAAHMVARALCAASVPRDLARLIIRLAW
jgi:hypothetical protein